jgi:hypothetical protein
VIVEFDEKALRRAGIQKPDALTDFLRLDLDCRGTATGKR